MPVTMSSVRRSPGGVPEALRPLVKAALAANQFIQGNASTGAEPLTDPEIEVSNLVVAATDTSTNCAVISEWWTRCRTSKAPEHFPDPNAFNPNGGIARAVRSTPGRLTCAK
jgi:hypothetical protein